jgi:hypothetical protein
MNILQNKKAIYTHLAALLLMILAAVMYCSPVLKGEILAQDDISVFKAESKETRDYREANGEEPLWTSRVFSGMTTFNISTVFKGDVMSFVDGIRQAFPQPVNVIIVTMLGFYLLLLAFGVNPWLALVGAIGYGLSSNLLVSLLAGHNTKVLTIGYMAIGIAGLHQLYNRKMLVGALLTAIGSGLMLRSGHYQIIYYFMLIGLVMTVVYLIDAAKRKALPEFAKAIGIIAISGLVGVLPSAGKAYNTYSHTAETIRGGESKLDKSEAETAKSNKGLDIEYAMRWSYGPWETMTMVVPSLMGGASGEALPENGNVAKALGKFQISKKQKDQIIARAPLYTGDQPFLLGPVYLGAGFIFLFLLALFVVKGPTRNWIIGAIVVSLIISWGRHLSPLTSFLFEYFPLYNKFRTPSMALAIAGLVIPAMGIIGLQKVMSKELDDMAFAKALKMSAISAGALMLILLIYGVTNDWAGANDVNIQGENSPWSFDAVYDALKADRKSHFLTDWALSTVIMVVTAGVVFGLRKNKLSPTVAYIVLALIIGGDMARVSKRYLNNDEFKKETAFEKRFAPSAADRAILQDNDPHHRVINLSVNPWTDGLTCYNHENVGGHHAAKLQRYQELIENQLSQQVQRLQQGLRQQGDRIFLDPNAAATLPAYNMLNTKYFILQPNSPTGFAENPAACGNAWFVDNIDKVTTAREEMDAIGSFNPKQTVVVSKDYEDALYNYEFGKDASANIQLTSFEPNKLIYSSNNQTDGFGVFSEVYYKNGWVATIDGEETDIYRVNYLLRGLKIPSGSHEIIMEFKPQSFPIGQGITYAGSALFVLFIGGIIFMFIKQPTKEDNA